jgi:threonine 3-dehydrogenase
MKVISKLKAEPGLWLAEEEKPVAKHGEVLINIKKTAVYKWDAWAQKTIPVPMRIGHEFYGIVEAVGDGVKGFSPGDRVSGEGHITCGHCRNCRAGQRHLCKNTLGIGVNIPGAFAEYFVMPAGNVCRIPDDITDDQAAMMDPFGNAVHSTLEFDLVGEDVLITGAGPIGLMSAAIARHVGARFIVISDINEQRLKMAEKMGATLGINPQKTSFESVMKKLGMTEGFDIGLEMSGSALAFQGMLGAMNNGGRIAFLGIPPEPFSIEWNQVIFKGLTIKGIYGRRMFETWYKGIGLLQSGVDSAPVISSHYPYYEFEKAFQEMLSGTAGKIILDWD